MLIKSIKLTNFRQFKDILLEFSTDPDKNVSIIIGENGSGKTTLQKSFLWCLYGVTGFKTRSLINLEVFNDMKINSKEKVEVKLQFKYKEMDYSVTRSQVYIKDSKGNEKSEPSKLEVSVRNDDGVTRYLPGQNEGQTSINQALPEELSSYFFFDGERIEKMGEEITSGNKSYRFEEAVKGLLGLDSAIEAKNHLSHNKYGVIGTYNRSFDTRGNQRLKEVTKRIESNSELIEFTEKKINEFRESITNIKVEEEKYNGMLRELEHIREIQEKTEEIEKALRCDDRSKYIKSFLENFRSNSLTCFSRKMTKEALELLEGISYSEDDMPDIRSYDVEKLIKNKKCICGEDLNVNKKALEHLKKLIEYLPPHSIGISIKIFTEYSNGLLGNDVVLSKSVESDIFSLTKENDMRNKLIDELEENNKVLRDGNKGNQASEILRRKDNCKNELAKYRDDLDNALEQLGKMKGDLEEDEKSRSELIVTNEENMKLDLYLKYAEAVYNRVDKEIDVKEKKIREELEKVTNDLFVKLYEGGLRININENYNIKAITSDNDVIETSTAQSVAIIFAFISGVIKLVKERKFSNKNAETEPYPLVMDAPLSSLDKKRIKSVCDIIPGIAEQVIIFIKDTDGEIAEEHLKDQLGMRKELKIIGDTNTIVR